jgi:hypothetical protein
MKEKIKLLKLFFTISVAAFELQYTISVATGYKGHKSHLHNLHLMAKEEIEKENPDLDKIDFLLGLMEIEAKNNSKNKKE